MTVLGVLSLEAHSEMCLKKWQDVLRLASALWVNREVEGEMLIVNEKGNSGSVRENAGPVERCPLSGLACLYLLMWRPLEM
jgi:hypothetical protein